LIDCFDFQKIAGLFPNVFIPESRPRNFKLTANTPQGALLHFAVPGNGSDLSICRILPQRMVPALTLQVTAIFAQMLFQIVELHTGDS
jgi:hypothetical protein